MVEYNGSLPTLVLNAHSWSKAASILFVDAPVHTGFSYSRSLEGSQTSDFLFATQSLNFLRKWLIAKPKFLSNRLYLGGDSFSGMIIPIIAEEIAKSIEAGHRPELNFQGYVLGNPATDIKIDRNSKVPFAHRMAFISDELYESVKKTCKGEYRGTHKNNTACAKDLEAITQCIENLCKAHILEPKCKTEFNADHTVKKNRISLLEKQSQLYWIQPSLCFGNQQPEFPEFGCRVRWIFRFPYFPLYDLELFVLVTDH
ncbi:hypothetical protein TIFTF001_004608 [Ficus carica]|uniref:Serine carboxypeptidase-like 18 n=1 Tax=Ficus carica TaxID=3494 RepID=A0AA87ZYU8_FICCA|nr:hypothetical protein TIFTF001_004608 [Ficus carica]